MADQLQLLLEAERRGLLPPDKMQLLEEAKKRGLVDDPNFLHPDDLIASGPAGGIETPGAFGNNPMAAAPGPNTPPPPDTRPLSTQLQDVGDNLSAGFTAGVNAIPVAGPTLLKGLEAAKGAVQGRPQADVATTDKAQVDSHPAASTIGAVTGTVLPFMGLGATALGARVLGTAGSLGSRMLFGAATGAGINAADTAVRGGSAKDDIVSAGEGGALGFILPVIGRVFSKAAGTYRGTSVAPENANVARAMTNDGVPVSEVNSRLAALGPDARVMDLGPNLQSQAGALASVPGSAQSDVRGAVTARAKGAADRVDQDVAATIGHGPDIDALKQQVVTAQEQAAKPIYDKVRNVPVNMADFNGVFGTDMGRKALETAKSWLSNDIATNPATVNGNTIGLIDYAKRALDDMASSAIRSGDKNAARQAANLSSILRNKADAIAPDYKAARDAFAGPAQVLDAIDAGSAAFTKDTTPAQLTNMLRTMSQSEQEGYLRGAQSWLEGQLGNAVNDPLALRNLLRKGWNEQKMRILIGDGATDDLLSRVDREATYGQTAHVVAGNSETARRAAAQSEVAPEMNRLPRPQGLVGLGFSLVDAARNFLQRSHTQPRINSRMGALLTSGQLSGEQMDALEAASKPKGQAWIAPAAVTSLGNRASDGSLSWGPPVARKPGGTMTLGEYMQMSPSTTSLALSGG